MTERILVKQKSGVGLASRDNVSSEVSRLGVSTTAALGTIVGLWSLACLFGGIAASGGPFALVGHWFKTVSGM